MKMVADPNVLLIHLGGLGDACISESTFHSLRRSFGNNITAVGNKRILNIFSAYFHHVESIDSRKWSYLFSESLDGPAWPIIVFIGKDSTGSLRQLMQRITENFIFISMYPDSGSIQAEDYQLGQLSEWGIEPSKLEISINYGYQIVLYPEQVYKKSRWPLSCFLRVHERLKEKGLESVMLKQKNLTIPGKTIPVPDSLHDIGQLFSSGGLFVSNDSGMAHYAARSGLQTVTIFCDTNPDIWRPKNSVVFKSKNHDLIIDEVVETTISLANRHFQ